MAVSGLFVWDLTRDQIITEALRIAGALGDWEAANANQIANAVPSLESIIKQKQSIGMPLWTLYDYGIACSDFTAGKVTIGTTGTIVARKPMKLYQAFLVDTTNDDRRRELAIIDRQSFLRRDAGQAVGTPSAVYLQPLRDTSELWVSPRPDATSISDHVIRIYYQAQLDDAGATGDNLNFPSEWLLLIQYELANVLAAKYGTAIQERNQILTTLKDLRIMAESFDTEEGSLYVIPGGR